MSRRGMPITKQMKLERRQEADARQSEYDKLSLQEKIDKLPIGGAKKQRQRLLSALKK